MIFHRENHVYFHREKAHLGLSYPLTVVLLYGVFASRDEITRKPHYFLILRDEIFDSRDETLISRDMSLVSRDEIVVSREW